MCIAAIAAVNIAFYLPVYSFIYAINIAIISRSIIIFNTITTNFIIACIIIVWYFMW